MHVYFVDIGLLHDDIRLTEEQRSLFETLLLKQDYGTDISSSEEAVVAKIQSTWKDGIVPYVIDNSLSKSTI